ncbi:helix-turn-helix transcriptional regulator [Sporosarcina sp. FSL K6-1522]|uniref:helix-turn-helix domain-containing protein n=1 Tax=Sporosarcina sp. FSL K6-1522 TaxID=2921554 RepID=UPI00315B3462
MTNQGFPEIKSMPDKISYLRKSEGMSTNDLAGVLRMPKYRIEGLESGMIKMEIEDVIRYCDYFALTYEPFLFDNFAKFKKALVADNEKLLKAIRCSS